MRLSFPLDLLKNLNPLGDMSALEIEEKTYQDEVQAVKQWWSESRWRFTKRPFTAEQIVQKRGTIKPAYTNNEMSKKLWNILEGRFKNGEASATYGCLDPVMVTQMAKYLDTVYVSGWQSSSTASATNEPGPDLADYPYVSGNNSSPLPVKLINYRPLSLTRSNIFTWLSSSMTGNSVKIVFHTPNQTEPTWLTSIIFVLLLLMQILDMEV